MGNVFQVGHEYTDQGKKTHPDDQFLRWINIPGSGMLNSPGIRPLKFTFLRVNVPAYVILVTHEKTGGILNPWEDVVDLSAGRIYYWGDAKYNPAKRHMDFLGNRVLQNIYDRILGNEKVLIPPILHFSKPRPGIVVFNGLCVMDKLELTWFEDQGHPVRNFRAHLIILDEAEVSVDWLHQRATCNAIKTIQTNSSTIWKEYLSGNVRKLDIWKSEIRSMDQQLPPEGSAESNILEELRKLSATEFEAITVAILKQLENVTHSITRTRSTADGGFDFFGHFQLPYPLSYDINFLGEAKKFKRTDAVQPRHVSRLVARLNRGQYGIFITTSYYTSQAQREVLEDGYPVKLFAGGDLIRIMKELRLIQNGKLNKEWMTSVLQRLA